MKELTIEQKARAYDEAIKKAAALYKASEPMSGCNVIIETLFPELKESEDEKVRQKILFLFYAWRNNEQVNIPNKKEVEKAIAWLEKQEGCEYIKKDWLEHIKQSWYKEGFIDGKYSGGTSKEWTINDAATLRELIDFLENGTAKLQHDLTRYANWLKNQFTPIEKQGEQKPVDSYCQENCKGYQETGKCFADGECKAKREAEQKHTWSEEDEKIMNGLIDSLTRISLNTRTDSTSPNYTFYKEIDWLKSLRQGMCGTLG